MATKAPSDSGEPPVQVRHRRRGESLEGAILAAAWEELQAVGYDGVSMEGVAARARTSKAVLYRRWRNRAELVLAAIRARRPMLSGETPDTGSLRGDVITLLRRVSDGIAEIGPETAFGLLDELAREPDVAGYLHAWQTGRVAMGAILAAAARRGEVRLERLTPRVMTLPVDLARHELFITRQPLSDDVITEIVDQVFLPLVSP